MCVEANSIRRLFVIHSKVFQSAHHPDFVCVEANSIRRLFAIHSKVFQSAQADFVCVEANSIRRLFAVYSPFIPVAIYYQISEIAIDLYKARSHIQ